VKPKPSLTRFGGRAIRALPPFFFKGQNMNFETWLKANGYDAAALSETQRKHLEAAFKAETTPAPLVVTPTVDTPKPGGFEQEMAAIERENIRVETIRQITADTSKKVVGDLQKVKRFNELANAAIKDTSCELNTFRLQMLREERSVGPMILAPQAPQVTNDVVEAAMCVGEKLNGVEKLFDAQTLQSAHTQFPRGLGLQQLLFMAAEQNGYRGRSFRSDLKPILKAAFAEGHDPYGMRADAGPSTLAVPGILSNIANKFLRVAFLNVEQSWRKVCTIRPVNDFKTITTYSLTGDNTYQQIAPGGEIKHGSLTEVKYTNAAGSYGRILGIDRRDLINDDLGAFTGAGKRLGRGASLKLNDVFWAAFLNDSAFFNTDASKGNYHADATNSLMTLAGLAEADLLFRTQTDPDGKILGSIPKILLFPIPLRAAALNLMNSTFVNLVTATTAVTGTNNIWNGMFEPVESAYLGASNTNGSDTAWYLLASPDDLPVIEVCFLFGTEMPTIETGELEFDRLGIGMRGYFDFGVSLQEYRGGVKMKGAA
jgi:hypothetical protein